MLVSELLADVAQVFFFFLSFQLIAVFVVNMVASVVQQFVDGLDSCGHFWPMVKKFWKQFLPVFPNTGQRLTRNIYHILFTVAWSPQGPQATGGMPRRKPSSCRSGGWWQSKVCLVIPCCLATNPWHLKVFVSVEMWPWALIYISVWIKNLAMT